MSDRRRAGAGSGSPAAADPPSSSRRATASGAPAPLFRYQFRRYWPALVLPIAALVLVDAGVLASTRIAESRSSLDRIAQFVRQGTEARIDLLTRGIDGLAARLGESGQELAATVPTLDRFHERHLEFVSMIVVGSGGRVAAASIIPNVGRPAAEMVGLDVSDRPYFSEPLRTLTPFVSDVFLSRGVRTVPIVAIAAPIVRAGSTIGVVQGALRLADLVTIDPAVRFPAATEILLLDRERQVIHSIAPRLFPALRRYEGADALPVAPGEAVRFRYRPDDERRATYLASWIPLRSADWSVLVQRPLDAVLSTTLRALILLGALASATILLQLLLARRAARRVAEPIVRLAERASTALLEGRGGELGAVASGPAEVYSLAETLDTAIEKLRAGDRQRLDLMATLEQRVIERTTALAEREQRLAEVLDSAHDLIQGTDDRGRLVYVNRAWRATFGYSEQEIANLGLFDLIAPESRAHCAALFERLRLGEAVAEFEAVFVDRGGQRVEVVGSTNGGVDAAGRFETRTFLHDVTVKRRAERALAASERRYRELVEKGLGLVCVHDLRGVLLAVNPAAAATLGYGQSELVGMNLRSLVPEPFGPSFERYLAAWSEQTEIGGFLHLQTRAGDVRVLEFRNCLIAEPGEDPYVLGSSLDVTDRKRFEAELKRQALQDPLTGLANRRLFEDRFRQALAAAARRRARGDPHCVALFAIDLDRFKRVNDELGHAVGDRLLVAIARGLEGILRETDTLARIGGDEFLLLLTDAGSEESLDRLAARVLEVIAAVSGTETPEQDVTGSLGIARYPDHGSTAIKLLAAADRALYAAKAAGRGCIRSALAEGERSD